MFKRYVNIIYEREGIQISLELFVGIAEFFYVEHTFRIKKFHLWILRVMGIPRGEVKDTPNKTELSNLGSAEWLCDHSSKITWFEVEKDEITT